MHMQEHDVADKSSQAEGTYTACCYDPWPNWGGESVAWRRYHRKILTHNHRSIRQASWSARMRRRGNRWAGPNPTVKLVGRDLQECVDVCNEYASDASDTQVQV